MSWTKTVRSGSPLNGCRSSARFIRASNSSRRWLRPKPNRSAHGNAPTPLRELVRGRMEVVGPTTATELAEFFQLPQTEIDAALLALEAEGFVLRGKFHPGAQDIEWCDRRLLARIHRLTINRLRAEIQPVSLAEFQRFLLAWQRVDAEPSRRRTGGRRGRARLARWLRAVRRGVGARSARAAGEGIHAAMA